MKTNIQITETIASFANESESTWISEQKASTGKALALAFVKAPRFISKKNIDGRVFNGWTLDQIVRLNLLTQLDQANIDLLFETAEMQEAVALTKALPYLENPATYLLRATDAVRSNMGPVFDAIAFGNTYPKDYFSEAAWNQLVLKCIFNDKAIHQIIGLDERANQELANTLSDFAHERWSAGRRVPSQVWRLVPKFMNESLQADIEKLAQSEIPRDVLAANLVIQEVQNPGSTQGLWQELELPEPIYTA
ncbi:EboA domain-containing protein [Aquirufa regiilacus]